MRAFNHICWESFWFCSFAFSSGALQLNRKGHMHILEVPLSCRRAKTFFDFLTGLRPLRWCSTAMESYDVYVTPPEAVRGCTTLNRPDFEKEFEFYGVKISDRNKKRCSSILQYLAHARVQCPYVKGVVSVFFPDDSTKVKYKY